MDSEDKDTVDESNNNSDSDEERDNANPDDELSPITLLTPESTGFFISRRMSGMPLMSPIFTNQVVIEESVLKELSALLLKFPEPPAEEIETHQSSFGSPANSSNKTTTWSGIKGLAASFWK